MRGLNLRLVLGIFGRTEYGFLSWDLCMVGWLIDFDAGLCAAFGDY